MKLYAQIPESLLSYIKPGDLQSFDRLLPNVSFSQHDNTRYGFAIVGEAEIEIELLPPDQIVGNMVLALRSKAAEIRSEATAKVTALESRAQQLLALENKAGG